ncbi:predicted protein [Nematostella vectensis]|uniref:Protein Wnt n=1 Tax=Nematostella vectensis TaxID=45351 RepID=A7T2P6_NEMVE|nr:predicted protein [Nematostella vectensis]|eukprot:XP_001621870.1 hypothetical protein NEMVEDRAFT_v1g195613 [Nematostella vectensis]
MPGLPRLAPSAARKELAFAHSIRAAGVTYALTRDCNKGILSNCACVESSRNLVKDWSGCHDNVKFGDVLSRYFLNGLETGSRKKALINLRNNAVGRRAVRKTLKEQCKCHGVSGSCFAQSCWKSLATFAEVGVYLKQSYEEAKRVKVQNNKLVQKIATHVIIPLAKKDRSLVFLKSSPDYCHPDASKGSTGVLGRVCSSDNPDYLKCSETCMSCRFRIVKKLIVQQYRCRCKFVWCCDVKCDMCKRLVVMGTCMK